MLTAGSKCSESCACFLSYETGGNRVDAYESKLSAAPAPRTVGKYHRYALILDSRLPPQNYLKRDAILCKEDDSINKRHRIHGLLILMTVYYKPSVRSFIACRRPSNLILKLIIRRIVAFVFCFNPDQSVSGLLIERPALVAGTYLLIFVLLTVNFVNNTRVIL